MTGACRETKIEAIGSLVTPPTRRLKELFPMIHEKVVALTSNSKATLIPSVIKNEFRFTGFDLAFW
ncbi:hypothetical protein CFPU101_07620 [Chroococcus sp. FPU101]|nr:hypothetical protein CFPU101_07620 [Chroococcus sp. FPU101]